MTDGLAILLAGRLAIFPCSLAIHFAGGLRLAVNGGGFGRQGLDFSADLTDVIDGSSTFSLRSALLEAQFRAWGYTDFAADCGELERSADGGLVLTWARTLPRHRKIPSLQHNPVVSGRSMWW